MLTDQLTRAVEAAMRKQDCSSSSISPAFEFHRKVATTTSTHKMSLLTPTWRTDASETARRFVQDYTQAPTFNPLLVPATRDSCTLYCGGRWLCLSACCELVMTRVFVCCCAGHSERHEAQRLCGDSAHDQRRATVRNPTHPPLAIPSAPPTDRQPLRRLVGVHLPANTTER